SFDADGVYTFLHGFGYEHAAPEDLRRFGNLLVWFARQCFSAVEGVDIRVWLLALLLPRRGLGAELTIMAMLVGCIVFLLILIVKLDKDLVEALFHLHQASSQ
ncbi:hypothetical protein SCA6_005518, partial [Theobroma cacao]